MSAQDVATETSSNGVAEERVFEDTGAHVSARIAAAKEGDEDTNDALARMVLTELLSSKNKGGGDGDGGAKVLKDIKKHKWLALLMTLVIGPGSMTATYYAIKDRGIANAAAVEQLTQDAIDIRPKIEANSEDIRTIQEDIGTINGTIADLKEQNDGIAEGVESLKKVNVDRLKEENKKLESKIRSLERNR